MINTINPGFLGEIDPDGKLRLSACIQCAKCSSGCPMHFETDLLPHQLIRLIQLGAEEDVFGSRAVWTCVSCSTCVSRCPMGVRLTEMIDRLRALVMKERKPSTERSVVFNEAFLASVRRYGRVYESSMLAAYKLRSRDFFGDIKKAPVMLLKGKLAFLPPRGADRNAVRRIFARLKETGK